MDRSRQEMKQFGVRGEMYPRLDLKIFGVLYSEGVPRIAAVVSVTGW